MSKWIIALNVIAIISCIVSAISFIVSPITEISKWVMVAWPFITILWIINYWLTMERRR